MYHCYLLISVDGMDVIIMKARKGADLTFKLKKCNMWCFHKVISTYILEYFQNFSEKKM